MDDDRAQRPTSAMRGRVTRRAHAAPSDHAGDGGADEEDLAGNEAEEGASWKQEIESITNGTHPALASELKKHEQAAAAHIAQAQRICQLQKTNIENLYECEKKQADDEHKAQLEFYRNRLIDGIEEKQRKSADQAGFRPRRKADDTSKPPEKCRKVGLAGMEVSFALPPDQMKADLEEIEGAVARYSVRAAAVASEDMRNNAGGSDIWFDRGRQVLHCNGHALERDAMVMVIKEGQRVDDRWTITAMNAVEVTLQSGGVKHKVTLAMLRNGRCVLRPV